MSDLLTTKLIIPRRRPNSVGRPRLTDQLMAGMDRKLTLVTASAGLGKTTLLSEWIPHSERCVSWVSLDEGDNDPARFWSYFIAALQMLDQEIGRNALALIETSLLPPDEAILTLLLNEIAAFTDDFALVLDDYQAIQATPIHKALRYLLEHLPPHMHLIISSRVDPPLPLSRMRARNQLNEIRSDALRFTLEESAVFLNQSMSLDLSTEQVETLETHTEGWIAGLQLAALAIQSRGSQPDGPSVSELIQGFNGSHRYIVSYLVEEVISQLPKRTMDFLLQTSILSILSGPLCDFVLMNDSSRSGLDSQSMLEQLEHANLFIVPLDEEGESYRYHQLFAEVLQHRLKQKTPQGFVELHLRASEWYEQTGLIPEAVKHALGAEDWARAARLIEQIVEAVALTGQVQTVLNWLNRLPGSVVGAHPTLCLYQATMHMFTNRLEGAEAWLKEAEKSVHSAMPPDQANSILGWVALVRADIARISGDLACGTALAQQALELLPENEALARAVAQMNRAHGYLATGRVTRSEEREAAEAIVAVRRIRNRFATWISMTNLARLQARQGNLHQAADTFALAKHIEQGENQMRELLNSASYYFGLAEVLREWNELEAAEEYLAQGMDLVQGKLSVDADVVTAGYVTLAKLKQGQGDPAGGIQVLDDFVELAGERKFFAPIIGQAAAVQAQILLQQGSQAAAARWMEESRLHDTDAELPYPFEAAYLTLARVMTAQDRTQEALRLLDRLLLLAEAGERKDSTLKILALQALTFHALGEPVQAVTVLGRALSLAEPEGYIRTFVDEGEPMRTLLSDFRAPAKERAGESAAPIAYADQLLAAFPGADLTPPPDENQESEIAILPEPLSDREQAVLNLIAAGASNTDIAQTLHIALSTVKRHTTNLYSKLGVNSRTQSVARARHLHLLS